MEGLIFDTVRASGFQDRAIAIAMSHRPNKTHRHLSPDTPANVPHRSRIYRPSLRHLSGDAAAFVLDGIEAKHRKKAKLSANPTYNLPNRTFFGHLKSDMLCHINKPLYFCLEL